MNRNINGQKRIINVSNRLPVKITCTNGEIVYQNSEGGLATGLNSLFKRYDHLWVGWPGAVIDDCCREAVVNDLMEQDLAPVFLSQQEITDYYEGFCNETLWPLFHCFPTYSGYDQQYYNTYVEVNKKFAEEVIRYATKDDVIWIHDYQLMLLPELIRKAIPGVTIGFFLHIPFPPECIFKALPWRNEVLKGLLGADLIGFQTEADVSCFTSCISQLLQLDFTANELKYEHRTVVADAFPISIDYKKYNELAMAPATNRQAERIKALVQDNRMLLSIDRLDYSKGILHRLRAFDRFLQLHPEWHEQVTLVHLVVPSRDTVKNYKELKEEMNRLISDINGKYATIGWQPVKHFYRSFPDHTLSALYRTADVALVTPLRDGMNLVSKEYVASNVQQSGVLILSEAAGAAKELTGALMVNPNDINGFADAIVHALAMTAEQRKKRMADMQQTLINADIFRWSDRFMEALENTIAREAVAAHYFDESVMQKIEMRYSLASRRLLLLDYDGTLISFKDKPHAAVPDAELLALLKKLSDDPQNTVVLISGRDRYTLQKWFGHLPINLTAEHGACIKEYGKKWEQDKRLSAEWKKQVYDVMNAFTRSTPGAFIEEKSFSIAWHYRQCEAAIGQARAKELVVLLEKSISGMGLNILQGNKVIEIKTEAVNKGRAASAWITRRNFDFIMAIGDDVTDEDMFSVLPEYAVSIKVGNNISSAYHFLNSNIEVRKVLQTLSLLPVSVDPHKSFQLAS